MVTAHSCSCCTPTPRHAMLSNLLRDLLLLITPHCPHSTNVLKMLTRKRFTGTKNNIRVREKWLFVDFINCVTYFSLNIILFFKIHILLHIYNFRTNIRTKNLKMYFKHFFARSYLIAIFFFFNFMFKFQKFLVNFLKI